MKLPIISKKGNKFELFLITYIITSLVIHFIYNTFLIDLDLIYGKYYTDSVLFTYNNIAVLAFEGFTRLVNLVVQVNFVDSFSFALEQLNFIVGLVEEFFVSTKYVKSVFKYVDWQFMYFALVGLVVFILLKTVFKLTLKFSLILLCCYVVFMIYSRFTMSLMYNDIDYISTEYYDSSRVEPVVITSVVDGDTVKFDYNGTNLTSRLLYIDTPEFTKEIEPYGREAKELLSTIINDSATIEIEFDGSRVDKYGRSLCWLWADGVLVQEILTKNGLVESFYDYGDYKYEDIINNAMDFARKEELNIYEN